MVKQKVRQTQKISSKFAYSDSNKIHFTFVINFANGKRTLTILNSNKEKEFVFKGSNPEMVLNISKALNYIAGFAKTLKD